MCFHLFLHLWRHWWKIQGLKKNQIFLLTPSRRQRLFSWPALWQCFTTLNTTSSWSDLSCCCCSRTGSGCRAPAPSTGSPRCSGCVPPGSVPPPLCLCFPVRQGGREQNQNRLSLVSRARRGSFFRFRRQISALSAALLPSLRSQTSPQSRSPCRKSRVSADWRAVGPTCWPGARLGPAVRGSESPWQRGRSTNHVLTDSVSSAVSSTEQIQNQPCVMSLGVLTTLQVCLFFCFLFFSNNHCCYYHHYYYYNIQLRFSILPAGCELTFESRSSFHLSTASKVDDLVTSNTIMAPTASL